MPFMLPQCFQVIAGLDFHRSLKLGISQLNMFFSNVGYKATVIQFSGEKPTTQMIWLRQSPALCFQLHSTPVKIRTKSFQIIFQCNSFAKLLWKWAMQMLNEMGGTVTSKLHKRFSGSSESFFVAELLSTLDTKTWSSNSSHCTAIELKMSNSSGMQFYRWERIWKQEDHLHHSPFARTLQPGRSRRGSSEVYKDSTKAGSAQSWTGV